MVGKQGDDEAWGDPHEANTDEGRGPLVLTLASPWSRLLEGSKDAHSVPSPTPSVGQCFTFLLVLPDPLAGKLLGPTWKYTSFSQYKMTHPTIKGNLGPQLLCRLLFKLFWGDAPGAGQESWTACTLAEGSEVSQRSLAVPASKAAQAAQGQAQTRPFVPRRARESWLCLLWLLWVLCSFPKAAHLPAATALSWGRRTDGNRFHK